MSIFKKLFGKNASKDRIPDQDTEFRQVLKKDFKNVNELLEQHAGLSYEKQTIFNDLTGGSAWNIDMNTASISFGSLSYPIQVIGSLSFNDYSWMWGWANTKSGIPQHLLTNALQLQRFGEQHQVEEFTKGHFYAEEGFEHTMGLIASGLSNANAYFCANYGQGTMVVTIQSPDIPPVDTNSLEKMITVFPQLISAMDIHHKNALLHYMIDKEIPVKISDTKIEGQKNGKYINAEFDEMGRMLKIDGTL
ncbi:DUF6882 domain-containing protein [Aquimarina sp. TRL1]|uniref:DUF6882 domain-containing protein n=1 Tax=Aquimarina sp. (strain TRL1) TaxID=2736252 RepID=UPI0020CB69FD|nr:DUF6882 domain-containing protein [Aquimarina sp. TRL1]